MLNGKLCLHANYKIDIGWEERDREESPIRRNKMRRI